MAQLNSADYWLGMQVNNAYFAVSAKSVDAVFLHPEQEQDLKDLRISGVLVHEGSPVYLRHHFQLLSFIKEMKGSNDWQQALSNAQAPWVVRLKEDGKTGLGFRVNNVLGPFYVATEEGAVSLSHDGLDYELVIPTHA